MAWPQWSRSVNAAVTTPGLCVNFMRYKPQWSRSANATVTTQVNNTMVWWWKPQCGRGVNAAGDRHDHLGPVERGHGLARVEEGLPRQLTVMEPQCRRRGDRVRARDNPVALSAAEPRP